MNTLGKLTLGFFGSLILNAAFAQEITDYKFDSKPKYWWGPEGKSKMYKSSYGNGKWRIATRLERSYWNVMASSKCVNDKEIEVTMKLQPIEPLENFTYGLVSGHKVNPDKYYSVYFTINKLRKTFSILEATILGSQRPEEKVPVFKVKEQATKYINDKGEDEIGIKRGAAGWAFEINGIKVYSFADTNTTNTTATDLLFNGIGELEISSLKYVCMPKAPSDRFKVDVPCKNDSKPVIDEENGFGICYDGKDKVNSIDNYGTIFKKFHTIIMDASLGTQVVIIPVKFRSADTTEQYKIFEDEVLLRLKMNGKAKYAESNNTPKSGIDCYASHERIYIEKDENGKEKMRFFFRYIKSENIKTDRICYFFFGNGLASLAESFEANALICGTTFLKD